MINRTYIEILCYILVILASAFVILSVIGGVRMFSPVPFWDMWNGYINFFIKVSNGDYSAWIEQHNEHRIIISRVLFWIDLKFFNGSIIALVILNFILAGSVYLTFFFICKHAISEDEYAKLRVIISSIICVLNFSWLQKQNLTWGFQSQFFLAQILPLCAFYFLYRFTKDDTRPNLLLCIAIIFGFASVGTMGNGILALPLMVFLSICLRVKWQKSLLIALLSGLTLYFYFNSFQKIESHGQLADSLKKNPIELLQYTFLYLGGPVYHVLYSFTGKGSRLLAQIAGVAMFLSSLFFLFRAYRPGNNRGLQLCLLTFIAYIGGTAFGTGGGRLIFGIDQALSSRYTTPSLMAWSALLIIFATEYKKVICQKKIVMAILFFIPAMLLPSQLVAVKNNYPERFERKIAALALEMGIVDQDQVKNIFPSASHALRIAEEPVERNLSIFGNPLIQDVRSKIGTKLNHIPSKPCTGFLDQTLCIEDEQYLKIKGWLFEHESKSVPSSISIIDTEGRMVGYALTGQPRPDVGSIIDKKASLSGYSGYIMAEAANREIQIIGNLPDCSMKVTPRKAPSK